MNSLNEIYEKVKPICEDLRWINDECMMIDLSKTKRVIISDGILEVNYRKKIYGVDYWDRNHFHFDNYDDLLKKLLEVLELEAKKNKEVKTDKDKKAQKEEQIKTKN